MNAIFLDSPASDGQRREALYSGQLFVYSPTDTTRAFVQFARQMIEQAFGGLDPVTAQYHLPVEEYAAILSRLKPAFIHHPQSKEFLQAILRERGCDPGKTYFDVPRLRSSTSDDYLTSGIAYAFHPHRDTWYSAPMCQLNWWLPVYEVEAGNVMAIHPHYFSRAVRNGSREYNYQQWAATSRKEAAQHIRKDTRKQPHPEEPVELEPQICIVTPPGGVLVFSAAHLHSSVPNYSGKTRFSIDFRTVHLEDLRDRKGARNIDSESTGTTAGDYLQVESLEHLPEEVVRLYLDEKPGIGGRIGDEGGI
ncbi:MAG: hypothetical protein J5I98_03700 [Phaeodactylibacter sp.]|nr:hypothetical protein [Phaeodactylibacter sp.]